MTNAMHPCFSKQAHRHGRMHLPVAPRCNIQCGYCDRRSNCVNESRPGVAATVLSPQDACRLALKAARLMPNLSVAGIAGPGDPLANPSETLETFRLVREAIPSLILCLSTNGLALPDYADELADIGVSHITVTVNAVEPAIGERIYCHVSSARGKLTGVEGAAFLLERQLDGIAQVKKRGLTVKANMVIVSGVNDGHVPDVARRLAKAGVDLMNCIPMAPVKGTPLGHVEEPAPELMAAVRSAAESWLPQMRHCGRCRADALGLIGESRILSQIDEHEDSAVL